MMMAIKHFSIQVKGEVQGVFFRASTKQKADELGLTGLVRNEPDGSVYIEAEGDEDALKKFSEWCKQGPPRAIVSSVRIAEGVPKHFTQFKIQR